MSKSEKKKTSLCENVGRKWEWGWGWGCLVDSGRTEQLKVKLDKK